MVPDQTQLCSKTFLKTFHPLKIRHKCARMRFWLDPITLEPFMIRLMCARIRLWSEFSDEIDIWPDQLQTMVQTVVRSIQTL